VASSGPSPTPNVIAGLYTAGGELLVVGRTVPLKPDQSAQLAGVLHPARHGHRWPDEITSYRWGGRDAKKPLTKVQPTVVAEVAADAATQAGQVRHGMRYIRVRAELRPEDLPTLPPIRPIQTANSHLGGSEKLICTGSSSATNPLHASAAASCR
jgi:hypothetical protein